jgi:hypothetical protein
MKKAPRCANTWGSDQSGLTPWQPQYSTESPFWQWLERAFALWPARAVHSTNNTALIDAAAELAGEVAGDPHLEPFEVGGEVIGYAPHEDPSADGPS